jgi:hypothetical protein
MRKFTGKVNIEDTTQDFDQIPLKIVMNIHEILCDSKYRNFGSVARV